MIRRYRSILSRLMIIALLLVSVGGTLSTAPPAAGTDGAFWVPLCTSTGIDWIAIPDPGTEPPADTDSDPVGGGHCLLCVTSTLPPRVGTPIELVDTRPVVVLQTAIADRNLTRGRPPWAPPRTRAPPRHSPV